MRRQNTRSQPATLAASFVEILTQAGSVPGRAIGINADRRRTPNVLINSRGIESRQSVPATVRTTDGR